jgi:8-amino-7-oxononanoate synthase
MHALKHYQKALEDRKANHLYRHLTDEQLPDKGIDFTSNDYLNLSQHPLLVEAAVNAAKTYGIGSTGARLLSGGRYRFYREFEKAIAKAKKLDDALLFSSGYQANVSVVQTLLNGSVVDGQQPMVLFDRLNHASLIEGITTSKAKWQRYQHNNMADLETRLAKVAKEGIQVWIILESVFSMDGDLADLTDIKRLAKKYNAFVLVDEAHATGIYGKQGYGLTTEVDWADVPLVVIGTFSKGLGGMGAYVSGPQVLIDYIVNFADGFVYSTAPSPMQVAAAYKGWELLPSLAEERQALIQSATYIRKTLREDGWTVGGHDNSPIIPVIIGDAERTVEIRNRLREDYGCFVGGIRPPYGT